MSECLWKAAVYTGRQAAHQWQAPGQCTSGEADKSWQVRPGLESDHTSPAGANTSADSSTLQVAWHRRKCDLPLMDHDWIKLDSNQVLFALWSIAGEDVVKCSGTMKETEESIYHWDKGKLEFFIVFILPLVFSSLFITLQSLQNTSKASFHYSFDELISYSCSHLLISK